MPDKTLPEFFGWLVSEEYLMASDILKTADGFFLAYKSVADILAEKDICDFPDSAGERLACSSFFDDWFFYAVPEEKAYVYGLLKLREQEHDTEDGAPADGDTPGVTVSFIAFDETVLLGCLTEPTDENRKKLNTEINRVVVHKGQRHHNGMKSYFRDPRSRGAYLIADLYIRHIASFAESGRLSLPEQYKEILQKHISYKNSAKWARLPNFIKALNQKAGHVLCDNAYIYIQNPEQPTEEEAAAILATHTGNTSVYSFAAEVEYHARFLMPLAKLRIPFFGRSIYDSAIRADMTVGDTEFEGPAPFHKPDSGIVKRQYGLHHADRNIDKKGAFL